MHEKKVIQYNINSTLKRVAFVANSPKATLSEVENQQIFDNTIIIHYWSNKR
jgi:hypothetical protein